MSLPRPPNPSIPPWASRATAVGLVALLFFPAASVLAAPAPEPGPGPFVPQALINASLYKDTKYLIVTEAPYASAMQAIADWKTQKGIPARLAFMSDIRASYPGRDDAERLHNFLQDVYFNASGRELTYVLLGGGVLIVPIRYLHTEGNVITWYAHNDVFSDVYYAGLNSGWDTNDNSIFGEYGEEDWDANVIVGRLPFNDTATAQVMADNILGYEKDPFIGPWMRTAVAFASVMDPPNNYQTGPTPPPNAYDWWEDNAIKSVWNTTPYIPPHMSVDILADYYQLLPGNYSPSLDRLSNASMVGAINTGASVVASVTHGWVPSGKGIPEYSGFDGIVYSWGQGLTYTEAVNLNNYGTMSFGYFSSCLIGNFSNPALPNLARFATLPNHGFIAMILPTDGTLRGEDDATLGFREGNWWQSENFWKNFFQGSDPYRPGPALYQGIRDYDAHIRAIGRNEAWGGYRTQKAVYNLIGDPEVPIWTDVAQAFNATLPSTFYTAEQHVRATLRDSLGRPAAGATVTLYGAGAYTLATTDAQGRIDAVVTPTMTGSILVTATLHNFIPLQVSIPVTTAPPDLAIDPSNVTLPSFALRTGETATVSFTVRNVGQQSAAATDARAYATPPGGTPQPVAPSVPLPALGPGESATASFEWTPTLDGVHTLRILVDPANTVAEFDELNNEVNLPVPVSSVDLAIDAGQVVLNPPGQVAPGSVLSVSSPLLRVGQPPRGYLIGYELRRVDGSVARSGNVPASTSLDRFSFSLPVDEVGQFTLVIRADSEDSILEFDELNNEVAIPLASGAGPVIQALPTVALPEDSPPYAAITLLAYVSDPDTPFSQLSFFARASDPALSVWADGTYLWASPAPDWSGSGTISLEVSDGRFTSTAAAAFAVNAVDDPPAVVFVPPQRALVNETFTLQLEAHDPDGDTIEFVSTTNGVPVDPTTGKILFVPDVSFVGTNQVQVLVKERRPGVFVNLSTPLRFSLVVYPENRAPVLLDPGPIEAVRGQDFTFRLLAFDPDGDPVLFSTDSMVVTLSADGTLSVSAARLALRANSISVTVTVSDGLASSSRDVVLVIRDTPSRGAGMTGAGEAGAYAVLLVTLAFVGGALGFTLAPRRGQGESPERRRRSRGAS